MDAIPSLPHHDITDKIISSFYATYNELAGFPEFVLRRAMAIAIRDAGLAVDEELPLPVWFRGHQIVKFRADLVVASAVIVEVKARPEIDPFNKAQVLHYLKATDLEVGLLLNFGRRPEFLRVVYEPSRKSPWFVSPAQPHDGTEPCVESAAKSESARSASRVRSS
jgi:GxxExxY protein